MIAHLKIRSLSEDKKKIIDSFILNEWTRYNQENKYVYKEKEFRYVAYLKGKIAGYIFGNTNGGVAYLDDIIVSHKYRGKGIGKILLKKFEEIARKNKCHAYLLATRDKHSGAIVFYKKEGYAVEAKLQNMYWNVNEYYMVKRLKK